MVAVFWGSLGLILYTFLGYPFFLFILNSLNKRPHFNPKCHETDWPTVSLVIAAYNEEKAIGEKLENSLNLDYPKDKLEIIVVSDRSSDSTDDIVRSYAQKGVGLHRKGNHAGKVSGHKSVLEKVKGDIVVFSDAPTMYQPSVIKELVKHFVVEDIGCVGGALTYIRRGQSNSAVHEQRYWSYEAFIRKLESKVDSLPAVSGAIYALRRGLYPDMPVHLADDLIVPLHVKRLGYRTFYEPNALCWDTPTDNMKDEFKKRKRIGAQNTAGLLYMKSLLNPFKNFLFSWILVSHKLLRLASPFLYVSVFVSSLGLSQQGDFWMAISLIISLFLVTSLIGWFLEGLGKRSRVFSLPSYFMAFNLGMTFGVFEALLGKKYAKWESKRG